jgi:hypothetical protein
MTQFLIGLLGVIDQPLTDSATVTQGACLLLKPSPGKLWPERNMVNEVKSTASTLNTNWKVNEGKFDGRGCDLISDCKRRTFTIHGETLQKGVVFCPENSMDVQHG